MFTRDKTKKVFEGFKDIAVPGEYCSITMLDLYFKIILIIGVIFIYSICTLLRFYFVHSFLNFTIFYYDGYKASQKHKLGNVLRCDVSLIIVTMVIVMYTDYPIQTLTHSQQTRDIDPMLG